MGLFSFKTRAAKQFEYRPRFFDPDKEAFQARMDNIKRELEQNGDGSNKKTKISFRDAYEKKHSRLKLGSNFKSSKIKLIIIVFSIILLLIFFYLLGLMTLYLIRNG